MGILDVKNLQIAFGGLIAVKDLTFAMERGEITSIIGPNGAGKTTVINLLTGFYKPDTGTMVLDGKSIEGLSTVDYATVGITRTFQNIRLFSGMSAEDNILIGMQHLIPYGPLLSLFPNPQKRKSEEEARERAVQILQRIGLEGHRHTLAGNLPYGLQRRLEIGRALAANPKLLLLDEPAAGMNPQESMGLTVFIRSLLEDVEAILLIEHDMKVVMEISDKVVVLNYGKKISEGTPSQIQADPNVIEAYLGKAAVRHAAN